MLPCPVGETGHRWLTQNRTGVRGDEICSAHPMARVVMTFPNTLLNECLHSGKNIDQRAHFRKRHRNQNSATKIYLFRKAAGESESRLEMLASEGEGLKSNNYDVGLLLILRARDALLFFCISENIKVLRFFPFMV